MSTSSSAWAGECEGVLLPTPTFARLNAGHGEEVGKELALNAHVDGRVHCQGGREVDFEQPRLQRVVQKHVEAEQLKAADQRRTHTRTCIHAHMSAHTQPVPSPSKRREQQQQHGPGRQHAQTSANQASHEPVPWRKAQRRGTPVQYEHTKWLETGKRGYASGRVCGVTKTWTAASKEERRAGVVHVCMFACVYMCVYVCMFVCVYVHT